MKMEKKKKGRKKQPKKQAGGFLKTILTTGHHYSLIKFLIKGPENSLDYVITYRRVNMLLTNSHESCFFFKTGWGQC